MKHVGLPRALEDYFAHAELERRGDARRFSITLPYLEAPRLGRLQWWWRVTSGEEALLGDAGVAARRLQEVERFKRHIDQWLGSTGSCLRGEGPIPQLASAATLSAAPTVPTAEPPAEPEATFSTGQRAAG